METDHEKWLAQVKEEVLEPDLPICDAHFHFFDRPGHQYFIDDYLRDIGNNRVVHSVYVEARTHYSPDTGDRPIRPVGETEFVLAHSASVKNKTSVATGIVGYADLTLGAPVERVLAAHKARGGARFCGIRNGTNWDTSTEICPNNAKQFPGLLMNPKFREGFACLEKFDLAFDGWMYHPQLMELVDLVRRFPRTRVVLNHVGGLLNAGPYAPHREASLQHWKYAIAELAALPNVFIKLGGLGMPNFGFGWHKQAAPPTSAEMAEAMAPYLLYCIEKFGANRCMFESNFPVDRMSYGYTTGWNAFKRITKGFSPADRRALFHDTAVKAYRLAIV